tara:strand:- start:336 stop:824 length:489 start_codon:yes stop_codon:yes gene_type:complete
MNNKGNIFGLFALIAVIFSLVVVIYIGKVIFTEFEQSTPIQADPTSKSMAEGISANLYPAFGNMVFIVLIGMLIFFAVAGFQMHQHPAFFPVSVFIVLPLSILIASIISNVHEKFVENATIATAADSAIITNIFNNLPLYVFGFGIILLIVIYGFSRARGET